MHTCSGVIQLLFKISNLKYSTIAREHIPKRHLDFENAIQTDKVFDDTNARIYGHKITTNMVPTSNDWGTGRNPADQIPRAGRKAEALEKEIAAQIAQEMQDKADQEERIRNMRCFDTTNRTQHSEKDLTVNVIGKKVMRTQDGANVPMEGRDEQLIVESGMWRRTQKDSDEALKARIAQGSYDKTVPTTIYTEALERKNVYGTASTGPNPFGVTRGLTQPVQSTKAVKGFEGNIDFEREKIVQKQMH